MNVLRETMCTSSVYLLAASWMYNMIRNLFNHINDCHPRGELLPRSYARVGL